MYFFLLIRLVTERIKVLCQLHVMRFSRESQLKLMKQQSIRSNSLCLKFTMRKFKICWLIQRISLQVVWKSEKAQVALSMYRVWVNILSTHMTWSVRKRTRGIIIDQLDPHWWIRHLVERIQSLPLNSNNFTLKKEERLRNSPSSIW